VIPGEHVPYLSALEMSIALIIRLAPCKNNVLFTYLLTYLLLWSRYSNQSAVCDVCVCPDNNF